MAYLWGSLLSVFVVLLLSLNISALIIPDHFVEPPPEPGDPTISKVRIMVRLIFLPFFGLGLWLFPKLKLKIFYIIGFILIPHVNDFLHFCGSEMIEDKRKETGFVSPSEFQRDEE